MTDVFFSYSSIDRDSVRPIRDALAAQGFDVFWDQAVPAAVDWDKWIREHLAKSKCALVFWSRNSIKSDNVRHEATVAKQQGKLIPVLLESLGADAFPMGLYSVQCANLADYSGNPSHPEWQKLQQEVEAKLMPPWARRKVDGVEAQLVAERARREAAEHRDQTLQDQIATEARTQQDLKRERDRALSEVGALKAQLDEGARARAELDSRAVSLSQNRSDAELLQKALQAKDEEYGRLKIAHNQLQKRSTELATALESSQREIIVLRSQRHSGSDDQHFGLPTLGFTNNPQHGMPMSRRRAVLMMSLTLIFSAALWEIGAFLVNPSLWPHLHTVFLPSGASGAPLLESLGVTLYTVALGYLVGGGIGVLVGQLSRAGSWAYELLTPLSTVMRWLPPPVLALFCMLWFGFRNHMIYVAVISFTAVLQEIAIPYAKGKFPWTGLRSGLLATFTWGIIIEMLGSDKGLGNLIIQEFQNFNISALFQTSLVFVALCLLADLLFRSIYAFTRPKLVLK